jgi:hypothetical protein
MPPFSTPEPDEHAAIRGLSPQMRVYVLSCVLAARPSEARDQALRMLGHATSSPSSQPIDDSPVDWSEIEAEAERQGCTVADVVFDRAGRGGDPL